MMVGILHLAATVSASLSVANRNSACLAAAAVPVSGRAAMMVPMASSAFWTSWRAAIGMAQCGSMSATMWKTRLLSACAVARASWSYSVQTGALGAGGLEGASGA